MSESFPRRVISFVFATLGIIVLTPATLRADGGVPWVMGTGLLMVFGLVPVIVIEAIVLRRRMKLGWPRLLAGVTAANIASTIVGNIALGEYASAAHVPHPITAGSAFGLVLIALVPLFLISWVLEYFVARLILPSKPPASAAPSSAPAPAGVNPQKSPAALRTGARLFREMFYANAASYLFLVLALCAFSASGSFLFTPLNPYSSIGSLRTINTAEVTYSSTYTTGFSATLAELGGDAAPATAQAAGLIDSQLAGGLKGGYRFVYTPGPKEGGQITTYTITASPVQGPGHGYFYFTDQTRVIRMNLTRPATATDSPLAG
jgi:hypothetical protein